MAPISATCGTKCPCCVGALRAVIKWWHCQHYSLLSLQIPFHPHCTDSLCWVPVSLSLPQLLRKVSFSSFQVSCTEQGVVAVVKSSKCVVAGPCCVSWADSTGSWASLGLPGDLFELVWLWQQSCNHQESTACISITWIYWLVWHLLC